ncbi:MAG: pyruvate, phosphate dikinase [Gemmatimonadales bacterium]|nr:MAG: pyruvate, phosphate dikinase [Gemmatimonadales bacterium]
MTSDARWVVPFRDGDRTQRSLLGGKGANLCEMTNLGLPVPPGFIVTTEACRSYRAEGGQVPGDLFRQMDEALTELEEATGRRLGDPEAPLLLAVRSGAVFSMPGMMDTVLDLGSTPVTHPGLVALGGELFAWDARRRFLEMFGKVVLGVPEEAFSQVLDRAIAEAGVKDERFLTPDQMAQVVSGFRAAIRDAGVILPEDPREQLRMAVEAVFRSWDGDRAVAYREMEGIDHDLGTAVNVQMMVFGNLNQRSASGVAFTRDPATGENVPYGDFLTAAQGEDVVAGTRLPEPLATLADDFPEAHEELVANLDRLEAHYRDMCDIEFTIEDDRLWMLQTRVGKRSALAALNIAMDLVDEGTITREEAVRRVTPVQVERLLHPRFADRKVPVLTTGLAASPGAATGKIVFSSEEARDRGRAGEQVILVRGETSPEDLEGMVASVGLLTARGGLVSHAAVVARGLGKPAVCGASALDIRLEDQTVRVGETVLHHDDVISIDGTTGKVAVGEVELVIPKDDPRLDTLLEWADQFRDIHIFANADTPDDARRALAAGAEGIGLCRTEHQFLGERLPLIRQIILSRSLEQEREALIPLEAAQRQDFEELFQVMDGKKVVIRLLDPPLHEFLPSLVDLKVKHALGTLDAEGERLLEAAVRLHEHDPMLGVRGIRLGVLRPAVYAGQVRAIIGAAVARKEAGGDPRPEIMLPLISTAHELAWGLNIVHSTAREVMDAAGVEVDYTTATMIETPRAALRAEHLAPQVDAFSFGTNDLTQLVFGLSRDDVEVTYLPSAMELDLMPIQPFATIDRNGVGVLVEMATRAGRGVNPDLVTGICGEHGGDPETIRFCHELGMTHVSASASRIKVARLAAAHAALAQSGPDASA